MNVKVYGACKKGETKKYAESCSEGSENRLEQVQGSSGNLPKNSSRRFRYRPTSSVPEYYKNIKTDSE